MTYETIPPCTSLTLNPTNSNVAFLFDVDVLVSTNVCKFVTTLPLCVQVPPDIKSISWPPYLYTHSLNETFFKNDKLFTALILLDSLAPMEGPLRNHLFLVRINNRICKVNFNRVFFSSFQIGCSGDSIPIFVKYFHDNFGRFLDWFPF